MSDARLELHAVADAMEAQRLAAARIEELVIEAIELRGRAHVALAGGATPRPAYELLAGRLGDPGELELWFGDERAVGPDDPESNYGMVRTAFSDAALPEGAIHRIEGERGPEAAAARYAELLCERVERRDGMPVLDLAVQGVGPDGHTASLFPGSPALDADGVCAPVHDAPKPPPDRVTLTIPALRAARRILFLVTGAEKAGAVATILQGPDAEVPASLLAGPGTEIVADRAALQAAATQDVTR